MGLKGLVVFGIMVVSIWAVLILRMFIQRQGKLGGDSPGIQKPGPISVFRYQSHIETAWLLMGRRRSLTSEKRGSPFICEERRHAPG